MARWLEGECQEFQPRDGAQDGGVSLWFLTEKVGLKGESEGRSRKCSPQASGKVRWFIQPILEFCLLAIIGIK